MLFQIKKIVLWPKKPSLPPREVVFHPHCVNVISGASRTGKSAIIPIIDYCLGADKCAIPVETIRNACSWFGVLVETDEGQKLFARREPGTLKSTGEMFVSQGKAVDIPTDCPQKNTTAENVKSRFDELSGLSRLDFDPEGGGGGFKFRLSFRDLMAFTFQPQNIVANPDVLFFKADTYEHREKLKTIFPYVLKAITPEILAAQHELEFVRRDLARKKRELETLSQVSERWLAELRAWAVQAREFGLIDDPIPDNANRNDLLALVERTLYNGGTAPRQARKVSAKRWLNFGRCSKRLLWIPNCRHCTEGSVKCQSSWRTRRGSGMAYPSNVTVWQLRLGSIRWKLPRTFVRSAQARFLRLLPNFKNCSIL